MDTPIVPKSHKALSFVKKALSKLSISICYLKIKQLLSIYYIFMWNYSVTLLRSKFCLYVICIPRLEKKKLQIYCLPNKK